MIIDRKNDNIIIDDFLCQPKRKIERKNSYQTEKKLSDVIKTEVDCDADIGLLGIPYDNGVKVSKGRPGARNAPDNIREQLNQYGTTFNIDYNTDISNLKIHDFGNIVTEKDDPKETYRRITKVLSEMVKHKIVPIVLGGSHDITYPAVKGILQHYSPLGGVNIDVHFDVREQMGDQISSGMGFRKLLDETKTSEFHGNNFVEIGADGNVNSKKYFDYLTKNNVSIFPIKMIRDSITENKDIEQLMETAFLIASKGTQAIFTSLDIDSVSNNDAPACSFPNPNGFSTDEISRIAHAAGYNEAVKYFDIVEVNPRFDIDYRTSRLCARIISCFLTGYKQRIERLK
ncbi:MAG: formimidoylglutamase [bacterium]